MAKTRLIFDEYVPIKKRSFFCQIVYVIHCFNKNAEFDFCALEFNEKSKLRVKQLTWRIERILKETKDANYFLCTFKENL